MTGSERDFPVYYIKEACRKGIILWESGQDIFMYTVETEKEKRQPVWGCAAGQRDLATVC